MDREYGAWWLFILEKTAAKWHKLLIGFTECPPVPWPMCVVPLTPMFEPLARVIAGQYPKGSTALLIWSLYTLDVDGNWHHQHSETEQSWTV
jgi:hypothetical protein